MIPVSCQIFEVNWIFFIHFRFNISKQRLKRILQTKEKVGNFTKLEQILELDGFGIKVFEKFCESILQSKEEPVKDQAEPTKVSTSPLTTVKKAQFITPVLHENVRKSIRTCVSLNLGLDCIAWTKFSLNYHEESTNIKCINVEEWDSHSIDEGKKLNIPDLIHIMSYVNQRLPEADAYVLEALPSINAAKQPGNVAQVNINIQKYQSIAMLSVLLANRNASQESFDQFADHEENLKKKSYSQQVFFLRNYLASRLFKVYVGQEKVSTEHVMEDILRYNYDGNGESSSGDRTVSGLYLNPMEVPNSLRHVYNDASRVEKDYLGYSFLIGLSFVKLCVLKCPESLNYLNKRTRA